MIYLAKDMYKLAYKKLPFEQEKQAVMDKIYEAASQGKFEISLSKHDFSDYRLMIAWLTDYGYSCQSCNNLYFNIKWEKKV